MKEGKQPEAPGSDGWSAAWHTQGVSAPAGEATAAARGACVSLVTTIR